MAKEVVRDIEAGPLADSLTVVVEKPIFAGIADFVVDIGFSALGPAHDLAIVQPDDGAPQVAASERNQPAAAILDAVDGRVLPIAHLGAHFDVSHCIALSIRESVFSTCSVMVVSTRHSGEPLYSNWRRNSAQLSTELRPKLEAKGSDRHGAAIVAEFAYQIVD